MDLLQTAIALSTILHELEEKGTQLTEQQDKIWFESTEVIEQAKRKGD